MRMRKSLQAIQDAYSNGDKKELQTLMRAWKGIKELPWTDQNSFFVIGGYHGEPFRGGGWGVSTYWGGYCNHGNVLFPTWHRVYLLRIEDALRSIPGCEDVTLPFWDETSPESLSGGIPEALTWEKFELDGEVIDNPLRSFKFNHPIDDNISGDNPNYSKPLGYETVRYPLSGLVGNELERTATAAHNAKYSDYAQNVKLLNDNVVSWLTSSITVDGQTIPTNVHKKYVDCLNAPNFTVFSNTTSAQQWNTDHGTATVPLESPHNSIHLAVGGFDMPGNDISPISGANGDMGENDTAGLDPIFFFHHCFVDRIFWLWQKRHHATEKLEIIQHYPGTNTIDNQGPTPGMVPNSWLDMQSPMAPFVKPDGRTYTSDDCIHIEHQLDYTYGPGSLDELVHEAPVPPRPVKAVRVSRLNRGSIPGSFLVSAFMEIDGKRQHIGTEAVLSRWNVGGCMNCQTHLEAKVAIPLPTPLLDVALTEAPSGTSKMAMETISAPIVTPATEPLVQVEVQTRDGVLGQESTLVENSRRRFAFAIR